MKAIVYRKYGPPDVLKYEDIDKPTPKDNEALIKVHAASVNPLDWRIMRGEPYAIRIACGVPKPKSGRPGVDVAGTVEAVGKNVTQFKPGDAVFGGCEGAFAEYACASESNLVTKPGNISFEQAAAVNVGALTALQGLRKGGVKPGHNVLINGAAGGVGTFAVQIAKSFGAEVTGVCSTPNVEMVRSIGADHVIDYTRDDFTRGSARYDLILDSIANHSLRACRRLLHPTGAYVCVGAHGSGKWVGVLGPLIKVMLLSRLGRPRMIPLMSLSRKEDLLTVRNLLETGKVTPVIDRRYRLDEVAEAVRYLETGHARGKVIITVAMSAPAEG